MATDDKQRLIVGTAPAPALWVVPGNGQVRPKTIFAAYNGAGAAVPYTPAIKIISDGGQTVGIYKTFETVAAGASAVVSWFPGVDEAGDGSSGGGGGGTISEITAQQGTIAVSNGRGPTANVDLPATGVTPGTYGAAAVVPQVTVDAEGRLTAATGVALGGGGIPAFNGARISSSVNQSIPNNTDTIQTFDTVDFDTGLYANLGVHPTRLTVTTTGYYLVVGSVAFPVGDYYAQCVILLNGSLLTGQLASTTTSTPGGGNPNLTTSVIYHLAAADYVEMDVVQSSGAAANSISARPQCPWLSISLLGT